MGVKNVIFDQKGHLLCKGDYQIKETAVVVTRLLRKLWFKKHDFL